MRARRVTLNGKEPGKPAVCVCFGVCVRVFMTCMWATRGAPGDQRYAGVEKLHQQQQQRRQLKWQQQSIAAAAGKISSAAAAAAVAATAAAVAMAATSAVAAAAASERWWRSRGSNSTFGGGSSINSRIAKDHTDLSFTLSLSLSMPISIYVVHRVFSQQVNAI